MPSRRLNWCRMVASPPAGKFRGVALHESFAFYVAHVAEISIDANGAAKAERVVCAVDCGVAVNPDVISAQMEGGIGFGLGAAVSRVTSLRFGFPPVRPADAMAGPGDAHDL